MGFVDHVSSRVTGSRSPTYLLVTCHFVHSVVGGWRGEGREESRDDTGSREWGVRLDGTQSVSEKDRSHTIRKTDTVQVLDSMWPFSSRLLSAGSHVNEESEVVSGGRDREIGKGQTVEGGVPTRPPKVEIRV